MLTDLELAFAALTAKKLPYDRYWNYYEGRHPLVYSRERLREIFDEINAGFTQNWCAVVVDSALERIQLRQFTVSGGTDEQGKTQRNEAAESALTEIFEANEIDLESDDVHLAALVCGESFVIAELTEEDGVQAYYNDPRLVHVFYEANNPRKMRYAAKWWQNDDAFVQMNLYYPDRIEYYITRSKATIPDGRVVSPESAPTVIQNAAAFVPAELPVVANEYSRIPVFHFRREHRAVRSELVNIIEPQDALNKLLNDMMIAAEFGAFRQRWIITQASIAKLKNAPNEIWQIPPAEEGSQPTQLGEFAPTELGNYISGIDKNANAIAIISRTPKHYFMETSGTPSGEALIAMEAPLNKKCQKYIDRFSSTWSKLGAFLLELGGVAGISSTDISPTFDRPETVQPRTEAEIRQMDVATGIPLVTKLRDDGWTDAEIEAMQQDKQVEQAAQQAQLGTALVGAMRNFDQNNANGVAANA